MMGGRNLIDATHVVTAIEGLSNRDAAALCGVAQATIRNWRMYGTGHDRKLAAATERITNGTTTEPKRRGRPHGSYKYLDIWITPRNGNGWWIDAYDAGTNDPTAPHGLTAPDTDTAVHLAQRTWGRRIDTIRMWTPDQGPVTL